MTDILLVPSAILIPDELRLDLGRIPTGMIPIDGKPMLKHIVDEYDDPAVYVACDAEAEQIQSYIEREDRDWSPIDVSGSRSLGDTVYRSLVRIEQQRGFEFGDVLRLNFADTLIKPNHQSTADDVISYSNVHNPVRWTSFETDEEGKIKTIREKLAPSIQGDWNVFTGVFSIANPIAFRRELSRHTERDSNDLSQFYSALHRYLSDREYVLSQAEHWTDVGHLDTYHRAKQESMNVRDFNDVGVLGEHNIVRKTSDKVETLASEYNWYKQIPDDLTPYLPQVYDFSKEEGYLELEYVGYPSLSDIHLYGSHGLHIWKSIFDSLFNMLDEFARTTTYDGIDESLYEMYVEKTERRLNELNPEGHLSPFFKDEIVINGDSYIGVSTIIEDLEANLESTGILDTNEFSIIHGDPCFSNVMFDIRSGVIKLIDPRGAFGDHVIYGDQRYDYAKIMHSVLGNYDFIINDLFNIDDTENGVSYEVFTESRHKKRQTLFRNLLRQRHEEVYKKIEIIESLLFLSMVPLHSDEPARQKYMLARGVKRFNNCVYER